MNFWLNLVLFQVAWVVTVAGAGAGYWWAGLVALVVLALVVFRLSPWPRSDFALLCTCCFIGLGVDSAFIQLGLLRFAEPIPFDGLAPIWILGMWMSFALTLSHSMRAFHKHLLVAAVFGLVGGPLAYYVAGQRFAAVEMLGNPWSGYLAIGLAWALATPFLAWLAGRWREEFDHQGVRAA